MKLKVVQKDGDKRIKMEDDNLIVFQDKPLCETLLDLQLTKEEQELLRKSIGTIFSILIIPLLILLYSCISLFDVKVTVIFYC